MGPRVGEDVLMSNVLAFDIKVWDPAASLGPDGNPGIAGIDDDGINGTDDYGELGAYGSDDGDWRDIGHPGLQSGTTYYGFYRKPLDTSGNPNPAALPNQYYSNPFGTPPTNRYDTWGPAVEIDGIPATLDSPPFKPIYAGPDGRPGIANVDDNKMNGVDDPVTELGWPGSDDFAPLNAIKITIPFLRCDQQPGARYFGSFPARVRAMSWCRKTFSGKGLVLIPEQLFLGDEVDSSAPRGRDSIAQGASALG